MSDRITPEHARPLPEALLAISGTPRRGRLKIFLGAAPGVGKTYAMLQAAQQRRREGIDVVVGIVETHGRPETRALVERLEVIPRQQVEYRGRLIEEMDLDAILARKPQLVLVDELAHANAPGGRHPTRYLDVEELIAAGIDIHTTLNVQHLESLNDAVAQITQVHVRETVPDRLIEAADEIQLIDLPPEELIRRLREGKVYVPDQASRAIEHFFRPANLNALRELALRCTAERVDDQMQDHMRAGAIPGPWPTTDRMMVCVSPSPLSPRLVRATKRRADRRNAPWIGVYVELPQHARLAEADQARLESTLRLVEQLGGEAVTIPGYRPADDVVRYARSRNVTEIIVGKSQRSWWQRLRYGSFVEALIRRSGPVDIHVISSDQEQELAVKPPARLVVERSAWAWSTAVVVATAALGRLLQQVLMLSNPSMLFLLGVLFVAVRFGLWPSIYACTLSALLYNFFFIEPLHTFSIAQPQELLAFIVYIVIAVAASNLAARVREQAAAARRREDRTAALFALSRAVTASSGLGAVAETVETQVSRILGAGTVVLMLESGSPPRRVSAGSDHPLSESDLAAATWAWQHAMPAGRGSETLPGVAWLFIPLKTAHGALGVLGVLFQDGGRTLPIRRRRLLEGLADLAAVALERARLVSEMEQARLASETERLRNLLLSSISHDLRTPLASIIGSVTSLLTFGTDYDASTRQDLLLTIQEEAERLNHFVGNLLDVTRLESGRLELNRQWVDVEDVLGTALARLRTVLRERQVEVHLEKSLPLIRVDFLLMEQVIVNLLDNAVKYSPNNASLSVVARRDRDNLVLEVIDDGPGIPPGERERVFDKFYRVRSGDRQLAGTGLGLSICRGILDAHGGCIHAHAGPDGRGTLMRVILPLEEQPQAPEWTEPV